MNGFLTLDEVVSTPPLPALASLVLTAGFAGWGEWGLRRCGIQRGAVRLGAAFIAAAGICAVAVHGLAMAHLASLTVLRTIAVLVALQAWRAWGMVRGFRCHWGIGITAGLVALAALGPVTDPDSLDYHLGVPLDWLRHSGVFVQPHWMHARVTGLGEALNMLGLAAGTDGLGALLQVAGLIVLLAALGSLGVTQRDRLFGMMLALPPAIIPLTTSQKPLLLPVAATVTALILARDAASEADYALVFGCIGFAMASKYSFLISGAAVTAAAIWWARKKAVPLRWAAVAGAVFVLPVLARNYWLYGDPMSPFFETLRSAPDTEAVRFAEYLRDAGMSHTIAGVGRFLARLVVPRGFGDVQTILGIGVFGFLLLGATRLSWAAAGAGLTVAGFTIWHGQMEPRYLLEPYCWCAAAVVTAPWSRQKSGLFYALVLQTAGVAAMAAAAAVLLFPGALTPGLRESTMIRSTYGYAEARWIDRVVPQGQTIAVEGREYALLPRPFEIPECASCGGLQANIFDGQRPDVAIIDYPVMQPVPPGCRLIPQAGPQLLPDATRNLFNRGPGRQVAAEKLRCE